MLQLGASALITVGLLGSFAVVGRIRARRRRSASVELVERLGVPPGQPAIVYLGASGDPGSQSRPAQSHVIVHRLPAESEGGLLRELNIASLPATIVIGRDHAIRAVHEGVADAEQLVDQLA